MSELQFFHPVGERDFLARDHLLQSALRPANPSFPIVTEYPLVLSPDDNRFSYCLGSDGHLVAHANLWPRTLFDSSRHQQHRVGLIGNVATAENWRGRGLMRKLFSKLDQEAAQRKMTALILWSDLLEFYQKLGFRSFGRELRFFFSMEKLVDHSDRAGQYFPTATDSLDQNDMRDILNARTTVPTVLERNLSEWPRLLSIPKTDLYARRDRTGRVVDFLVVGRGYDMEGVVHEWGVRSCEGLFAGLAQIAKTHNWPEIVLLCPTSVNHTWKERLKEACQKMEEHPIGLARVLDDSVSHALTDCFIWGLDSI